MEISRLPPVATGRPAGTAYSRAARPDAVDEAARAAPGAAARERAPAERVRVVEGELLQRESGAYQSTRAFIDERAFDHALARHDSGHSRGRARTAISHYLSNTPAAPVGAPASVAPRAVNFYV